VAAEEEFPMHKRNEIVKGKAGGVYFVPILVILLKRFKEELCYPLVFD
jgi:hypothetical protein